MIEVLLADDHALVRAGIKRVLEEADDIRVVAEAADGLEAVRKYSQHQPDVAVIDVSMPSLDGLDACKQIVQLHPGARLLVLTIYPESLYAMRFLKAGALGYITKGSSTKELHNAVRSVARGQMFLPEEGKDEILMNLLNAKIDVPSLKSLSDRELQVLCFLARGSKMKEIAATLHLSTKTVETYRSRILTKLNFKSNADLVLFAHENKLI
jgi:DNA-binding NarL/FixJ family response regulator